MILGVAGTKLSPDERALLRDERPWGFILFSRNIAEESQLRDLVAWLRDCVEDEEAPVLVDQEGGRVQRLRPPLAGRYPPAAEIGRLFAGNEEQGVRAAWLISRLHAFDLGRYGIDVDCLPVLDVPVPGAHDVIGDRAYSQDAGIVSVLGRAAVDGLMAGGVVPVVKHIPGHGRAFADSHKELPTVTAPLDELRARDFVPFQALRDVPMAMSAHVVFTALDPAAPATISPRVVEETIRGEIGFDGLLMSDDVSMEALSGDFATRTRRIVEAGCDLVLHCNGRFEEMRDVARAANELTGRSRERAERARAARNGVDGSDEAELRAEFAGLFEAVA